MKDLEEFQRYLKKLNKKMKFKTNNVKFIIIKYNNYRILKK